MGKAIFFTSFKGGVGKTTAAANIALPLCALGYKVLIIDADFGNRCMDLVLGTESFGVFDFLDVLRGTCPLEKAIIKVSKKASNLSFIPAPMNYNMTKDKIDPQKIYEYCKTLKEQYDYVLIDSSAERTPVYDAFAAVSDMAIIVSLPHSTSIRAAENTAIELARFGFTDIRLIINAYHEKETKKKKLPEISSVVGRSGIKLLGVVPFDINLLIDQNNGVTALYGKRKRRLNPYEAAYTNIVYRLIGSRRELLKDVYKPKKGSEYFS